MLRHVTRVGGLCELHLNLAKWKQTKHIVCVRMKASLWRAVTEGFLRRGCGLSSDAGEPKSPFSKRSSQHGAQLHVWAKKSHRKKPITSQEYNSPLILSFVKNVHAPFARGLRHLGLSLDCFWRRFPCVQLFYLRLRMTSIRGKERRLRERLRCDRIAVRILCGCFFFFPLKKNKTKRQSRNVFEHSEIFNIRTEFRWKREHRGCGRQKHSSRPPTRDTPLNLQMGASVYRALVCCPSAPKNQEGMSDGDGDGGWWMGMQRERNSRFVFVPFTQKPRRVIARSTPRRWKVGWEYRGGGSHSLL